MTSLERHPGWTEAGHQWLDAGCPPTSPALSPDAAGIGGESFPNIGPDPMKGDRVDRIEQSIDVCREAYVKQQSGVPDQTALVWRWHLGALLECATRLKAILSRGDANQTREAEFIAAIHERTPTGAWIAVQHHPDGDWAVAEYPLPWLPGEEVAVNAAQDPNGPHFALTGVDGMTVMTALPAWPRNDHTTMLRLMLAGVTVDEATIATWTDDQCREADVWSCSVHLSASDDDDIRVPSKPAFLPSLAGGKK
jgi:hypothetical protein